MRIDTGVTFSINDQAMEAAVADLRSTLREQSVAYFGVARDGRVFLRQEEVAEADLAPRLRDLRALGAVEGRTLMVHSSLAGLGHVLGGAPAAVRALLAALGPDAMAAAVHQMARSVGGVASKVMVSVAPLEETLPAPSRK